MSVTTMQQALINAGLVSEDRAEIFNRIQDDIKRKREKRAKSSTVPRPKKLNQNRKQPAQVSY